MKNVLRGLAIMGVVALLSSCSSHSVVSEPGDGDEAIPPPTDAATDSVPQPGAEGSSDMLADAGLSPPPADQAPPPAPIDEAKSLEAAAEAPPPSDAALAPPPADAPPAAAPEAAQATPEQQPPAPDFAPTAAPAPVADSGNGSYDNYTVQRGDTLMKVAFETYGDLYQWHKIYDANRDHISNPNSIPPGTILKVERPANPVSVERNGEKYLIKSGDTLGTISTDVYGTKTKWKTLWENNRQMIKDPNRIFAGFYLYYVPDPNAPQPAPLAQQDAPPAPADAPQAAAPAPQQLEAGGPPPLDNGGPAPASTQ